MITYMDSFQLKGFSQSQTVHSYCCCQSFHFYLSPAPGLSLHSESRENILPQCLLHAALCPLQSSKHLEISINNFTRRVQMCSWTGGQLIINLKRGELCGHCWIFCVILLRAGRQEAPPQPRQLGSQIPGIGLLFLLNRADCYPHLMC